MPRAIIILIIVIIVIAGVLFFLSSRAHEVPTHPVTVDVTNASTSH